MFSVPKEWAGECAVVFGGGPSLTKDDVAYAIAKGWRRIACNDAFILDPEADALCAGDARWWNWQHAEVAEKFKGRYLFTWCLRSKMPKTALPIRYLKHPVGTVSRDPGAVCCNNTGGGAINIAYLFGATSIVLLGFDMRYVDGQNNWHERHKAGTKPQVYTGEAPVHHGGFIPKLTAAAKEYKRLGVEVINCTPASALTCFPFKDIRDI